MTTPTRPAEQADGHLSRRLGGTALLVALGLALLTTSLLPLIRSSWPVARVPVPRVDDIVSGLLAWASLFAASWLTAATLLTFFTLLPGVVGRAAARCVLSLTPALLRRSLSLLLGTGIGTVALPVGSATAAPSIVLSQTGTGPGGTDAAGGAASPATHAAPDPAFSPSTVHPSTVPPSTSVGGPSPRFTVTQGVRRPATPAPDPRWLPSRPVRAADPSDSALLAPTPRSASIPEDVVTVRRGDSLWSLAARHLGPHASDRDVARAWPQWYAVNADVIGHDPDLIHPGQQLRIPTPGGDR